MNWTTKVRGWAKEVFARIGREHVLDSASAASFWIFVSLVPLAAVALMLTTKLAWANEDVLASMLAAVPPNSRTFVSHELQRVGAWNGGTVGPASAAVFVWLAATGVHAILDAFDATVDAKRPWWKKRLLAIAICIGLSVAVAAVGIAFGLLGKDVVWIATKTPARWVIAIVAEFGLIVGLFWAGIARSARCKTHSWPGAILAAILQSLLGWGYVSYLRTFGNGTAYSGATLATIGATMIMIYLFTLSLLIGVTFNAVLARRREPAPDAPRRRWRLGFSDGRSAHESS
ncbi:MAG TPA: YihY/virulence factor BrkB family protein [Polyangiaceae bacterium]|jgi:membrane protein